jgi:hypothetical protein
MDFQSEKVTTNKTVTLDDSFTKNYVVEISTATESSCDIKLNTTSNDALSFKANFKKKWECKERVINSIIISNISGTVGINIFKNNLTDLKIV